jgi:hypothetical protein
MLAEALVASRWAYRRGQLLDLYRTENLSADSSLWRRGHALARLSTADESVTLSFQGKRITFPAHALEAVQFVAAHEQFRIGEIPDVLDEAGKLVLVKRLIREGFLTPAEPSGAH